MANPYNNRKYEASPVKLPLQKLGLFLLLISVTMLFVSFSLAYVYTRVQNGTAGVYVPPIFVINAVLLFGSSWFIERAKKAYKADDTAGYKKALNGTFIMTCVFLAAQYVAWTSFKSSLFGENIGNGVNYLYAITGLHFAHIVGGVPFLLQFIWTASQKMQEPMTVLIYFSDPTKKMNLDLLTIYWHYLDILWIVLVVFFGLNWLIA